MNLGTRTWRRIGPWEILLAAAVVVVVVVRIRLLTTPLERDEGEYAYGGALMLQGIPPYKLLYNMKFPGIYAAYAACMALFGRGVAGIHFGLLLVNLGGVMALWRLALRILDRPGAATAAAAYALLSASPVVLGGQAHATQFVTAAALAGLWALWKGDETGRGRFYALGGVLLGVAGLMKQPGVVFAGFGFCHLAARAGLDWRNRASHLRRVGLYVLGGAAPLALTLALLWSAGVWDRFWFWTFTYAKLHAGSLSPAAKRGAIEYFFNKIPLAGDGLFWAAAVLGALVAALRKPRDFRQAWLFGFTAASAVAVAISGYFSTHYFVMFLPALGLLAGALADAAVARARGAAWVAAVPAAMAAAFLIQHGEIFFSLSPVEVCKKIYGANPFVESAEVGRHLDAVASPNATIAVLGSEPELFFHARRHSATGYIYMYDITAPQPYAGAMEKEMIAEIEASAPEYVVVLNASSSWRGSGDSPARDQTGVMTWAAVYLKDHYDPAGWVVVRPQSEFHWGPEPLSPANAPLWIRIYKRK